MSRRLTAVVASSTLAFAGALVTLPAASAPPTGGWDIDTTLDSDYSESRLATNGEDGFACYRIPALTTANDGTVLASWDGRPDHCGDAPNPNSIVLRTSSDHGETWDDPETITAGVKGSDQVGYSDPSFVVDRETGEIFNFFVKSYDTAWHQSGMTPPSGERDVMHAVYISSTDNGKTWSDPVEVTGALDPGGKGEVFNARFAASGEGIQLRYGPNKGRLIQQYTVRDTTKSGGMYAVSLFSDDHGETWQAGEPVGPGMDENKVVELSDGRVMLNSRSSVGGGFRWVAYSEDGGKTYSEPVRDYSLVDPANNASITRAFPSAPAGSAEAKVLLFSNAASSSSRSNGTISVSFDDGQNWTDRKVFAPGGMSYSTLTTLADGSIGLLFEPGGSNIQFATFTWDWLDASGTAITASDEALNRGEGTVEVEISRNGFDGQTPAGTLTLQSDSGLNAETVDVPAIDSGKSVTVSVPVTVGEFVDPGTLVATAQYEFGDLSTSEELDLTVELLDGEFPSNALPQDDFEALDFSTPQAGEGPENMFDGNVDSLYHTAYDEEVIPGGFTVDLGENQDLAYVSLTPRSNGSNGTIGEYKILLGDSADDLSEVASGTWPANSTERNVYLDGASGQFVRVEALSSYGDTPDQWISVAEFNARTLGDAPVEPLLDISLELSSDPQETYVAGDEIPVSVKVSNPTDQKLDAVPREGSWNSLLPDCRYVGMEPGFDYTCDTASYTVSDQDLARGYVDLAQTWAVDDKNVSQNPATDPLQEFVVDGPRVNLGFHVTNVGPDEEPEDIVEGTTIQYTFEYMNTTDAALAVVPIEGEFSGFHINETPNCRYGSLPPSDDARTCTTAQYTVTSEDMAAGVVAPGAKFAVGPNADGEDPYFVLDVPAPEITFDPVVEEPVTAVSVEGVEDVEVPAGTPQTDAIAALAGETTLIDSDDEEHVVSLDWSVEDYDADTAGDYSAVGTFDLPDGVEQTEPAIDLEVTATITVLAGDDGDDGSDNDGDDNNGGSDDDADGGDDNNGDDSAGEDDSGSDSDDDASGNDDSEEDDSDDSGHLPSTGVQVGAIALALSLVLAGVAFYSRSRKQA